MGLGQLSEGDAPVLTTHTPRLYKVVRRLTDLGWSPTYELHKREEEIGYANI